MKVGRRTFNSSHQIYHRRQRWAMAPSPRWEPSLRRLLMTSNFVSMEALKSANDEFTSFFKLNFFEFTPTETSAGGNLLYIANNLLIKCRNNLDYIQNE